MRVFRAAAVIALLAGPAYAQTQAPVPRYGEENKGKTPQEIAAEKEAEKAYKKSLSNIPEQAPSDPWGNVRGNSPPKAVAKDAPVKRAKTGGTAN
jgi:hypothetical protein